MPRPFSLFKPSPGDEPNNGEIQNLRRGDQRAFTTIFDRYYKDIAVFTYRFVGDYQQAEDIAVELFTKVWDRREQWENEAELRMFLYRSARNAALNVRRDETRHHHLLTQTAEYEVPGLGVAGDEDAERERDDRLQRLNAAIQKLPEMRRAVFTLRWEQAMPYAEIATLLGISLKTAKMHMGLALKDLRELVKG